MWAKVGVLGMQVSMVDISEEIGRVSCSELQKDFPASDVMFLPTDVTKREQLVSHVCMLALALSLIVDWLQLSLDRNSVLGVSLSIPSKRNKTLLDILGLVL